MKIMIQNLKIRLEEVEIIIYKHISNSIKQCERRGKLEKFKGHQYKKYKYKV